MSEKRFVYGIIKGSRQAHIKDCKTCKSATIDVYDDDFKYFVDLLNTLHQENNKFDKDNLDLILTNFKQIKERLKLMNENKQLKQENEHLRTQLKTICNTCCYDCEENWCEK